MLPTYPAILRAGRLEWGSEDPPKIPLDKPVRVHVTFLADTDELSATGSAMAAALSAIAAGGGPNGIADPTEWQRESRVDRTMPGRVE